MSNRNLLTEEGQVMFDNIAELEKQLAENRNPTIKKIKEKTTIRVTDPYELEVEFLRLELRKLIKNSEMVMEDCDTLIKQCETKEDYLKNEARVAKIVHLNMITRFKRILANIPAFDHEIEVPVEERSSIPFIIET